jgi:hypothetical protein
MFNFRNQKFSQNLPKEFFLKSSKSLNLITGLEEVVLHPKK